LIACYRSSSVRFQAARANCKTAPSSVKHAASTGATNARAEPQTASNSGRRSKTISFTKPFLSLEVRRPRCEQNHTQRGYATHCIYSLMHYTAADDGLWLIFGSSVSAAFSVTFHRPSRQSSTVIVPIYPEAGPVHTGTGSAGDGHGTVFTVASAPVARASPVWN